MAARKKKPGADGFDDGPDDGPEIAAAVVAPKPALADVYDDDSPTPATPLQLKKKEFIDLATARSGIRKPDARAAIEATLTTMAQALSAGQDLILPPLGRIKVIREKPTKKGRMLMLRLQLDEGATAADPLADVDDQG